jgi:putative peptidoglycan lipid II flippase
LLFEWQAFSAADVAETDPLLLCYAAALPFYSLSTFVSRGFHSLQDTRTPVRIAMVAFGVNLVGSLIGMQWLGTLGLALANMLAAIVQSLLLHYALKSKGAHFRAIRYGQAVSRILIAAAVMGLFAWGGAEGMSHFLADGKALQLGVVVVVIPLAVMLYFAVLMLLKFEDMSALLGLLRARRSARAV